MKEDDFDYTLRLISAEAENLYKLTRKPELGISSWCSMVAASIEKLNSYLTVQSQ